MKIDETYHVASCCCPFYAQEVSGKKVTLIFSLHPISYLLFSQATRHSKKASERQN